MNPYPIYKLNGNIEGRKNFNMINLTENEKAYIAGFIDGDGCILSQIIKREDYKYKFQIRVSITFYQKKKRH